MIPATIIPRLKAEYDPEAFPREFKPQDLQITNTEYAQLNPGDAHQANGVIAMCRSKEFKAPTHSASTWEASFEFQPVIET